MNNGVYNLQQAKTVEKQGAVKSFVKHCSGTGNNRYFVWTAKPQPPIAMSMDSLGEDLTETLVCAKKKPQRLENQKYWRENAGIL